MASDPRVRPLRRMQALALALLLLALAGLVGSQWMGGQGGWRWVRAFCEAAAVGALADWFAVTALFRRPLGLPIPHTAIIPASKDRIADSLAEFVRDHFLDARTLSARLALFDPAARLGQWLSEPANVQRFGGSARVLAAQALAMLDEQAIRASMHRALVAKVAAWDAAGAGGELMAMLTRDGRHQELLDLGLQELSQTLGRAELKEAVAAKLESHVRAEWPKISKMVGWVTSVDKLTAELSENLASALIAEVSEVLSTPDHPYRARYEAWFQDCIRRLQSDPDMKAWVNEQKRALMDSAVVHDYVNGIWGDLHEALQRDLAREDSALARYLERGLLALGHKLAQDPALREAINSHVLQASEELAATLQRTVTQHIAQTLKAWDEARLVEQIELSVGRDLQYIRLSGTLVGGLIGLALHALLLGVAALGR